jgi:toxin CptA
MNQSHDFLIYGLALLCAGTMGFAIQRGATCTVAAVAETLTQRKLNRLVAMIEAAIWVLGGLLLGNAFGLMGSMPLGYALSAWTVAGAALLGVGAAVNRACVIGAIARFGNGEWVYQATSLGFYLGCLVFQIPAIHAAPRAIAGASPVLMAPIWLGVAIGAWMMWHSIQFVLRPRQSRQQSAPAKLRIWAPHEATLIIGATFLLLLWLVGPWTYTDLLAEHARGGMSMLVKRGGLLLALLTGAVWAGVTAGFYKPAPIRVAGIVRCLVGGTLMGIGSVAIPGGNDGLILTGLPLLWPHAWVAFITMCASIALYLWVTTRSKPT